MEPNNALDWDLLAKYFAGECNDAEEAVVATWRDATETNRQLIDDLRQVWVAAEVPNEEVDIEAAWQRLRQRTQPPEPRRPPARLPRRGDARPRQRMHSATAQSMRVVLVVVGVTLLALLALWQFHPDFGLLSDPAEATPRVLATARGQRATVQLTDGTRVHLNVDSKLTLTSAFGATHREVLLQGEAFFDVAPDVSHPFTIRTDEAVVQVLGTQFNVRAYPDELEVAVAVAEGQVSLRPAQAAAPDTVVIRPRSLGQVAGGHLQDVRRDVFLDRYLAWQDGRLVFEDAPFDEVTRQLARWYDLHIEADFSPAAVDRLNATFTDEPLSEILKTVATALDLRYEREARHITFSR